MKNLIINIKLTEYQESELSAQDKMLVEQAIKATDNSYAKYSNFRVGAALLLADGTVVIGANQENAAFPSGLCAERSAIFAAQSQRPDQPITALAIAARNDNGLMDEPVTPCGACRQVVLEIEDRYKQPVKILLYGKNRTIVADTIKDLMPLYFVDESMK